MRGRKRGSRQTRESCTGDRGHLLGQCNIEREGGIELSSQRGKRPGRGGCVELLVSGAGCKNKNEGEIVPQSHEKCRRELNSPCEKAQVCAGSRRMGDFVELKGI